MLKSLKSIKYVFAYYHYKTKFGKALGNDRVMRDCVKSITGLARLIGYFDDEEGKIPRKRREFEKELWDYFKEKYGFMIKTS